MRRWLRNLFMGAHWPLSELDFAGTDLATSLRLLVMVRKQRNNPAAGYGVHVQAFRALLVFLVGVGLSVVASLVVPQPWIVLGGYLIGSMLHALVPPSETLQERMSAIQNLTMRKVPWIEQITRDWLLRLITGLVWGQFYFFALWVEQTSPTIGMLLRVAFWGCIVWELIGILRRELIRREINTPRG